MWTDIFSEILKFTFFVVFGMLLSYVWGVFHNKSILVVVAEATSCEVVDYSLMFDDQIVSANENQIRKLPRGESTVYEKMFSFVATENSDGYVVYKVRARYKDCDEVVGPSNRVKPGWVIYESIKGEEVLHEVRSH